MTQYRAAVIGLGWTGLLYDLAPLADRTLGLHYDWFR